jgi:hypothetical protein
MASTGLLCRGSVNTREPAQDTGVARSGRAFEPCREQASTTTLAAIRRWEVPLLLLVRCMRAGTRSPGVPAAAAQR